MTETHFPPAEWIQENDKALKKYADETSLFNVGPYIRQANLRYLAGQPLAEVFDSFHQATLCLSVNARVHLHKTPYNRFRSRRIDPVELAILAGNEGLLREMGRTVGISIHPVIAGMADNDLLKEVGTLTTFFETGTTRGDIDLAGFGALVYAGSLAALAQGFDDEARAGLDLFLREAQSSRVEHRPQLPDALARYLTLDSVLNEWIDDDPAGALPWIEQMVARDVRRREAMTLTKENAGDFLDRNVLALMGLSVLRERPFIEIDDPVLGPIFAYMSGDEGEDLPARTGALEKLFAKYNPS
jgi:hypothetical protein